MPCLSLNLRCIPSLSLLIWMVSTSAATDLNWCTHLMHLKEKQLLQYGIQFVSQHAEVLEANDDQIVANTPFFKPVFKVFPQFMSSYLAALRWL